MRTGTKDRVLSQFMAAAQHAVPQQAFTLRVAGGLHLPSDLGHCVQHVEFGSRGYGGKPWIHHILDSLCKAVLQWRIYQQQALSQNNIWSIFFFLPGLGWRYSVVLDKRSNTDLLVTSIFWWEQDKNEWQEEILYAHDIWNFTVRYWFSCPSSAHG